jgi:hypothetical protein
LSETDEVLAAKAAVFNHHAAVGGYTSSVSLMADSFPSKGKPRFI